MNILITFVVLLISFTKMVTHGMVHRVDITQTAINNGNFKTLVAALTAADLATTLRGRGPFTVFAPTDAAFSKLPAATIQDLLKPENKATLANILKYHVIPDASLTAANINSRRLPIQLKTLDGRAVHISRQGNQLRVNDAKVIIGDVFATNGVIHAIDTVLLPPEA